MRLSAISPAIAPVFTPAARLIRLIAPSIFLSFFVAGTAIAQEFPSKPITIVVTYPAGGGADLMARMVAPKMSATLKQPVIVENRPGASGQIAASMVAKAAPDGYTLMLDASSYAVNPSLFAKLPYDTDKAFTPIGVTALFPNVLVSTAGYPVKSVADVIALAKKQPGAIGYASSGNGSAQHLAGALFELQAKVDMLHVPYKGGGPALIDVIGGQVPFFFANVASSLQHIKGGKLQALAVTSSKRSAILPDVPTIAEAGVPGYQVYEWNVIVAPAGTPAPVLTKLAAALRVALDAPDVRERIAGLGGEVFSGGTPESVKFLHEQTAIWSKVVKDRGIKPE
ncbi:MAG: tripartite tricarboxylate transporter substrate binding protein [Betaproteobacteria bacterium]|nr:tripartite tricarboxylate transporter substrate binding protein [Betaproteobacteria bacterium]